MKIRKKPKDQKKKKKDLKEIRIRPRIADHDLNVKLKQAQKFLDKGLKVKITCMLRGRDKYVSKDIAKEKMERFAALGRIMNPLRLNGSNYIMTIV